MRLSSRFLLHLYLTNLLICVALVMNACSSGGARYVKNSSSYTSLGIDRHDIESIANKSAKNFLDSEFLRDIQGNKLIAISDLQNLTKEDIDVEFFTRKFTRIIRKNKKLALTNAISGSGANSDKFVQNSRNLTQDKLFNQHTTQEDGTLLAPDYSLSGKIIERTKSIGSDVRIDYSFLLVLTDLKSGRVVWDDEQHISKIANKAKVANFKKLGDGTCDGGDLFDCDKQGQNAFDNGKYEDAYKFYKKACSLGGQVSCENADYAKTKYKEFKKEKRGLRIGLLFGGDVGIGSTNANMVPIPYTSEPSYSSSGSGFIRLEDDYSSDWVTFPYMLKAGVYMLQKAGLYFNANILYGGHSYTAADSEYAFSCTGSSYGYCSWESIDLEGLSFSHKLIGLNARIGLGTYNEESTGAFFVGAGIFKDHNSKMKGKGAFVVDTKIENSYPFWEIGFFYSSDQIFFIETSYRYMFDGEDNQNFASVASLNIGVGLMLPIW